MLENGAFKKVFRFLFPLPQKMPKLRYEALKSLTMILNT